MHIVPRMETGGVEESTRLLLQGLSEHGHQVALITAGGSICEHLRNAGIPIYKAPVHSKNPLVQLLNIFRIAKVIKSEGASIIHTHSRAPAWSAFFAAIITNSKTVTTFHSFYGYNLIKHHYNKIMVQSNATVVPSSALLAHVQDKYGADRHRVSHIPHFTNTPLSSSHQETQLFREFYNIPKDATVFAFIARPTRWKCHNFLIETLGSFTEKNICLLIISPQGSYKDNKSQIDTNIRHIKGSRKNIHLALSISDALLSLSNKRPEGFGLTMLEAMSHGVPIIACKHGGALDLVNDNLNGFLYEPGSNEDFAKKLQIFLEMNHENRSRMRAAALSHSNKFSSEVTIQKLIRIYQNLSSPK